MLDRRSPLSLTGEALLLSFVACTALGACSSNDSSSSGGAGGTNQAGGQKATSSSSAQGGSTATSSTATSGGTGVGGSSASDVGGTSAATSTSTSTSSGGSSPTSSVAGGAPGQGGTKTNSSSAVGGSSGGSSSKGGSSSGGATGVGGAAVGGNTVQGTGGTVAGGGPSTSHAGVANKGGNSGVGGGQAGASSQTNCASRVLALSSNTDTSPDPANAHVEVDMKTDLPIANSKRTVEFWAFIKSTDWVGEKNQVYYYGGSDATGSFGLDFGTPTVTGSSSNHATLNPFTGSAIRDDSGKDLGINSSSDQWVHIAMTWDGTVLTTYVNGLPKITAQGSGSTTTLNTAQSVLMIGCNPTNNNCFDGYFSEFRVWNVARSDAEIKDSYKKSLVGNETGLVGYWKFDDAAGSTTAADAVTTSGHTAHNGTLKADTTAHNPTFIPPSTLVPITCP